MSNPAIEAWSAAIRDACEQYSKYLVQRQYGTQGICCCAGGALLFDLDFGADEGNDDFTSQQITDALYKIHPDEGAYDFVIGLSIGFDGEAEGWGDDKRVMIKAGIELGAELLAQYAAQMVER